MRPCAAPSWSLCGSATSRPSPTAASAYWSAAPRPTSTARDVAVWANPAEPLLCPVAAVSAWRRHRDQAQDLQGLVPETVRRERSLFCAVTKAGRAMGTILSDKAVVRLVKGAASKAGLDPERYSGHSLRAGLATAAGHAGAALPDLMRQTRHKRTQVALAYLRPADLWRNNVTERVFAIKPDDAG